MMVDPWGTYNMYLYTNGLCESLAEYVNLTLWTNYYFPQAKPESYRIRRVFFRRSEKMKPGMLRNVIRICEYYRAYSAILKELGKIRYDLVHIQWLLHYRSDAFLLRCIKKRCSGIIYTAHNILPHRNGKKHYSSMRIIYDRVDKIVVHGESIKHEFNELFKGLEGKICIQHHGSFEGQDLSHDRKLVNTGIIDRLKKPKKVFIFFGNIFYNKGVDRLAKIWLDYCKDDLDCLLVIAGRKDGSYQELEKIEPELSACSNIIYINHFIDNNLLNYLIEQSHLVLLPYRHASMSGVLFTAAEFKKPLLSTKAGAIEEYLTDGENSFLVENNDRSYANKLKTIIDHIGGDELSRMGNNLHYHIRQNYSWKNIGRELAENIYRKYLFNHRH